VLAGLAPSSLKQGSLLRTLLPYTGWKNSAKLYGKFTSMKKNFTNDRIWHFHGLMMWDVVNYQVEQPRETLLKGKAQYN
jgi:hypothetical protein